MAKNNPNVTIKKLAINKNVVLLYIQLKSPLNNTVYIHVFVFIRPKKHFKNEQRSKDAATKKDLIQVE